MKFLFHMYSIEQRETKLAGLSDKNIQNTQEKEKMVLIKKR